MIGLVGSTGVVGSTGFVGSTTGGITGSTGSTGSTGFGGLISNYLSLIENVNAGYFLEFIGTDAVKVMKTLLFSAVY